MQSTCGSPATTLDKWIVVNTHPHKENIAIENLVQQKFQVYCPKIHKRIKHARRVQDVLRPLFPCYLFVNANTDIQRWRPILSTIGVRSLLTMGERPGYLDTGFIQSLKAREINGAIARPENDFSVGQRVQITGGPFDGLVASIIQMDERDRLTLLLDLLKRPVKVKIETSKIAAI
jgi:transcriptional antiterminator RfaH